MLKPNAEQALCDALDAAGRDYEHAVRSIESLSREISGGSDEEQVFRRLQQIALRTRETETNVSRLRENWARLGQRPGDRLRLVLQRQEGLLHDLIRSLDAAEQVARTARRRLIPELEGATRSQQMHRAYAQAVRQAAE